MKAGIITIGQEILIGQVVDTNSAWICSQLSLVGIDVCRILSISDSGDEIKSSIIQFINDFDIVLITGGLGPTSDDITKQTLCDLFNTELEQHNDTLKHITKIFAKRGLPLTDLNIKQADVPKDCKVIFNPNGTAPGLQFDMNGKILIAMPGVPFEMIAIMERHVLPMLKELAKPRIIVHKTTQTFGLPESFLAEKLAEWEQLMPKDISVAYLPSPSSIRIRLSSSGFNKTIIEQSIQEQINKLNEIIPKYIFGFDDDTMSLVVGNLLKNSLSTIALAESCTGGYISHLITQVSGSSNYYIGGMVAYSNQVKIDSLGVNKHTIEKYGAVSIPVVEEMAQGARHKFNSTYAIATSGIAGPLGASNGKPVGTVCIAVSSEKETISKLLSFGGNRERNILISSITALNMLRLKIIEDKKINYL